MAIDPNPNPNPCSAASIASTTTDLAVIPPSVMARAERAIAPRIVTPAPMPLPEPSPWAPPYPGYSSGDRGIVIPPFDESSLPWKRVLPLQQRKKARKQPIFSNPQNPLPLLKDLPSSIPHPKVGSSSSVSAAIPVLESNGHKNMRDKFKGDALTVVKNRNVRLTEGSSLYALCRSWLRNGFPEEIPPRHGSTGRSLPKPSPIPKTTEDLQMKESEEEDKDSEVEQQLEQGSDDAQEEGEESVENVSTEDLFKRHIKRAKKVRARLREVRLKRIARYKSRLALLLPPLVEQFRNDASGAAA